ncbi:DNA-directed RNA polymerase subunit beta' [bacterium]|jgi:DNA-directed RNA polymerase subunit beta'|nr:DNA-directed RNA polymerase subunit beta' [bacterium]MBT6831757.1 DNA-directed RNA polymerase subunit beta' [bacterium]MBT6996580.1 DNA-directed RNA polymerase subunit beta' [bacterium]MBT7772906.1 DNA-directed RNA polymerase subunit beta' [bacterium]
MSEVKRAPQTQILFDSISISIASPEDILSWSHGEITKPETINYRTQKPEPDGLFCEKIFGPVKNWECACGKYKRIRYKGIVCEKCGVEVTRSSVRRERMGHIKLAVPVTHPWFLFSTPSKIGLFLNLPVKKLELVIYFAAYVVVDVDLKGKEEEILRLEQEYKKIIDKLKEETDQSLKAAKSAVKKEEMTEDDFKKLEESLVEKVEQTNENYKAARDELKSINIGEILTELGYRNISMKFGHIFRAGIGADAIREIIQKTDLKKLAVELEAEIKNSSGQKQKKAVKRLKLISSFMRNKIKPEWMVLTVIPVISPDLRPMVQLDGGRFATSDLNDLYRRVINRNARLKKLIQLGAPEIICRNEKRMLQEAVDILISNSSRSTRSGMNYSQRRKLKSLSDMLKGKQGRFRQNLLGKRVDYSGRSVIAVGPNLKLDQCGLPKKITLELFKPFVISKLIEFELAYNAKSAEKLIRDGEKVVWDILDEVIKNKYVLLNRAPTLHRLGIQAFRPQLVEGKAIRLHPLVCAAYNADFDGDQMAVYLPLSEKAQTEAREIMCSAKNLLKPSSGDPIINPSQDMVLGCYFLTQVFDGKKGEGNAFPTESDAIFAYESGHIHLQAKIKIRTEKWGILEASIGRMIFNQIIPDELGYQNASFGKKELSQMLAQCYTDLGIDTTAQLADAIKDLGFKYATKSGISISVFDFHESPSREKIIEDANQIVNHINSQYRHGLITDEERYNNTIKIWSRVKSEVTDEMIHEYDKENDIFYQIDSGARGNWGQVTQISGMKGLVASPSGRTIELPIRSNLKRGFTILEYFIATHGGRKGKSDTALKTAEAGYLTRRLVDSVQNVVVHEEDCHTEYGKLVTRENSIELGMDFERRVYGRFTHSEVKKGKKVIFKKDTLIGPEEIEVIRENQVAEIEIRSVMYCQTRDGVCQHCYGYDLGKSLLVEKGTPVGIIAAQSIGEPGTQLTMRTFHMGGVATEGATITQGLTRVEELFEARSPSMPAELAEITGKVSIKKGKNDTKITIQADKPADEKHVLGYDFEPSVKKGDAVKEKQIIARSTEEKATVKSRCSGTVVSADNEAIVIRQSEAAKKSYTISARMTPKVKDGSIVEKGTPLTLGHLDLRKLMELTTVERVQEYILYEVQQIYASQGQDISEKHIEIIVKQMASKIRVIDAGDSDWLAGEVRDYIEYYAENKKLAKAKKRTIRSERLLLGLTRIALWTDSWLSAASFQETVRVLVNAAVERRRDTLDGLKENVIIGRLIPAGTGYASFNRPKKPQASVAESH